MSLRFWRPSLLGRLAAKHLIASVGVLALVVGLLTTSGQVSHSPSTAVRMPQPLMTGQPQTTTVHSFDHNSSVPRSDIFARGYDGILWHKWWENGVWYDWESLGIPIDSAPAAVSLGGNGIDVFYRLGPDLWHVHFQVSATTTTLTFRENLGYPVYDCSFPYLGCGFQSAPPIASAPAVTSMGGGRIDVFAFLGGDTGEHTLAHRWWTNDITNGNGWSDWEILSNADFAGDPAAVSWGGGMDVFVHGSDDNHVYFKAYVAESGLWSSWGDLGGTVLYSPAAASWGPGRIDVYAIGTDHQLWTKWFSNGQWSGAGTTWDGWAPLGGYFIDSPGAGSLGPGALDVVGLSTDYQLYHSWWGGQWSPWAGIGSPTAYFISAPAVVDSWVAA